MADNLQHPMTGTGTADVIQRTDDLGAAGHVPYVKLLIATDGSTAIMPSDATAGLKVDLGADNDVTIASGTVTTVSTVTAVTTLGTITNVVHVDDNAASLTVDNAQLSVVGTGTEAAAMRVTIATDSTGVLSVDDNGGSLTVDAPVGTPAFVRLSDGAAAIATLPVSLASVPSHAVTNAGTFAVQVDNTVTVASHAVTNAGTFAVQPAATVSVTAPAYASATSNPLLAGFDGRLLVTSRDVDTERKLDQQLLETMAMRWAVLAGNERSASQYRGIEWR